MNIKFKVLQFPDSKYLKYYEYSQGMEYHERTKDIDKAINFNIDKGIDLALTLYKKFEVKIVEGEIETKIKIN